LGVWGLARGDLVQGLQVAVGTKEHDALGQDDFLPYVFGALMLHMKGANPVALAALVVVFLFESFAEGLPVVGVLKFLWV